MAGTFKIGETKIRPGVYFRTIKKQEDTEQILDGVVAVLFKADFGPVNTPIEFTSSDTYKKLFGNGLTTDVIAQTFKGGAKTVIGCRVGKEGTFATVKLTGNAEDSAEVLTITAKYPGSRGFAITIRDKVNDVSLRECIIYTGATEYETIRFAKGENEAASLAAAFGVTSSFQATVEGAGGELATVNQKLFTPGTDMTVVAQDYSKGLEQLEMYSFNLLCADTEDPIIHQLMMAFLDRIYEAGQLAQMVIAEKGGVELETRLTHAESYNSEKVIYVLNAAMLDGGNKVDGYQTAARIAGMVAGYPANMSLTHNILSGVTELGERLTPTQMTDAQKRGSLVLSYNSDRQIWIDNAINTLVILGEDQDAGWKKIRRVKTRHELIRRLTTKAESIVGNVDNDKNGRATVISQMQDIGTSMVEEGKLVSCTVAESADNTADGDSAWFEVHVIDKDSIEHIYLTFQFQFSTNE